VNAQGPILGGSVNGEGSPVERDPEALLTAREAAEILAMTERWVRDAAREGRLPHVPLGKFTRFRRGSLLAWIEAQEVYPRGRK
jgi:excisionase family DNA binding protein